MSNLRTRAEHLALGGSPWSDFDSEYRAHVRKAAQVPSQETHLETPEMETGKQGDVPSSQLPPKQPRSIALAVVAANAVHAAYEAGYSRGFHDGQRSGLDFAESLVPKEFNLTHDPGSNPF